MAEVFTNLARSTLAAGIAAADTELRVQAGDGSALFPVLAGSDFFRCLIFKKATGDVEIITVTARAGDVFTIARAQEGVGNQLAVAQDFDAGDLIELRPTKGFFDSLSGVTSSNVQAFDYNYAVDTGVANAYVVALTPSLVSLTPPLPVLFLANETNTAASDLTIGVLAAAPIKLVNGADIIAGDIVVNKVSYVIYDGITFTLLNPRASYTDNLPHLDTVNVFTEMQQFSQGTDIIVSTLSTTIPTDGNYFKATADPAQDLNALQNDLQAGTTFSIEFRNTNITLKHNAAASAGFNNFELPGDVDRTMQIGDIARFTKRGSAEAYTVTFDRADGLPPVDPVFAAIAVRDVSRNLVVTPNATTPATQLDITADEIILQDSTGDVHRATAVSLTADISSFDTANGRDFLTLVADTVYHVWVIWDGTTLASLISDSESAPTFPTTDSYTHMAYCGIVHNDIDNELVDRQEVTAFKAGNGGDSVGQWASALVQVKSLLHGRTRAPDIVKVVMECVTDDLGYVAGDIVELSTSFFWIADTNDTTDIVGMNTSITSTSLIAAMNYENATDVFRCMNIATGEGYQPFVAFPIPATPERFFAYLKANWKMNYKPIWL